MSFYLLLLALHPPIITRTTATAAECMHMKPHCEGPHRLAVGGGTSLGISWDAEEPTPWEINHIYAEEPIQSEIIGGRCMGNGKA